MQAHGPVVSKRLEEKVTWKKGDNSIQTGINRPCSTKKILGLSNTSPAILATT